MKAKAPEPSGALLIWNEYFAESKTAALNRIKTLAKYPLP